jgi:hypothetical protein
VSHILIIDIDCAIFGNILILLNKNHHIKTLIILLLQCLTLSLFAQNNDGRAFHLTIDNDSFLFLEQDQYYTSGISAQYIMRSNLDKSADTTKSSYNTHWIGVNHQIYTPIRFNSPIVANYDRPHAALAMLQYKFEKVKENNMLSFSPSLGWMGPALRTGEFIAWFHNIFGYKPPRGWLYQINNSPVVQLELIKTNRIFASKHFDTYAQAGTQVGTIFNNAQITILSRIGRFKNLSQSMHFNHAFVKSPSKSTKLIESYALLSTSMMFVAYNSTIEGNFIGRQSVHTESIWRWINLFQIGYGAAFSNLDLQLMLNWRSVEVTGAKNHQFVTIKLNYHI